MEERTVGPYVIEAELGSGGMGRVYAATVRGRAPGLQMGTRVALKVIHAHLLEIPGFLERFLREAEIGRTVVHENVVRTFDRDATALDERTQHFLVMEYVEGQTLRELLAELEKVPEDLCRHIGLEVAKGLSAIHEAGVVHRDIKPENVLITKDHAVKIMDLGVARLADESIRLSRTGVFVGSMEYAAPEQFRSGGEDADARADLHALGVMLYELGTGQHPFREEDARRLLHRILEEEPRKAGEVNPQLSPFFEEVVHTLMAKDRNARFESAAALATVFEEGEKGEWWKERAKALQLATNRPLRRIRIPRETALYGREDDIARLRELYEKAKAGEGQVALIQGEAGIGKSRLVDEFVGRLQSDGEDLNFLFGSYPPGGAATASGAFSTAYREQFGEDGSEPYLQETPLLVPAFDALLRGDATPADAESLTKDSLQTCFVRATHNLAEERPTVILIDDLHFAPEEGRSLFMALALAVPERRILLVGTTRRRIDEEWTSNLQRVQAVRLPLSRLCPKDLIDLLKEAFGSERLAEELGLRIAEKSDGNPFFAFEIIRGLREDQFIAQQEDGTWVIARVIEDIQIPISVLDLVDARVSGLTDAERALLDVASCWGFEFDPGLVGEVLGMAHIVALRLFGQMERRHRLVRAVGRTMVFDHHLVQEALNRSLLEELREEYHAALADVLETRTGAAAADPETLDGTLCVDLCEHYLEGARGDRALRYLDVAQEHLRKRYLNAHAIALAERALAVPGLLDCVDRANLLRRLCSANGPLDLLGRRDEQRAALDEALALADRTGDESLRAKAKMALGVLLYRTSRYDASEAALREALDLAKAAGDRKLEAASTGNLGNAFFTLGRYAEAQEHHERALALSGEIEDHRGEAFATGNLGIVFIARGHYAEAQEHLERQLALSREIGDRRGESIASGNLGIMFSDLGRYVEAREHLECQLALSREIGDRRGESIASGNLGSVFQNLGRYAEAREHYGRALALNREVGHRPGESYALDRLARCEEAAQGSGNALGLYEEALALRRDLGEKREIAETLVGLGRLKAAMGETENAAKHLEEALVLALESESPATIVHATIGHTRLPGGNVEVALTAYAKHAERMKHAGRMEARFRLWELTGDKAHLEEAHRLLCFARDHAPEGSRDMMIQNVPLHRDIMKAWEELGKE